MHYSKTTSRSGAEAIVGGSAGRGKMEKESIRTAITSILAGNQSSAVLENNNGKTYQIVAIGSQGSRLIGLMVDVESHQVVIGKGLILKGANDCFTDADGKNWDITKEARPYVKHNLTPGYKCWGSGDYYYANNNSIDQAINDFMATSIPQELMATYEERDYPI